MIQISETLQYNENLPFNQQTEEVQGYISNKISEVYPQGEVKDEGNRIVQYTRMIRGDYNYNIVQDITYVYPLGNRKQNKPKQVIVTVVDETWHVADRTIQIKQDYYDNLKMLVDYPELAVNQKTADIPTFIEVGYVYSYVNQILPEHAVIIEQEKYNVQIKYKN